MIFNAWSFAGFFVVVLFLLPWLPHRGQNRLLLVASFVFYGSWDWRFVGLLLVTILTDYTVGLALETTDSPRTRRRWLWLSLATNLGILGFFKYWNFFADTAETVLASAGLPVLANRLDIILPVGISFYTFQSLGYVIDRYRRQVPAVTRLEDYALFVGYFPLLLAGPIERASTLVPQLTTPRYQTRENVLSGAWLILWGLFKKVVIADNLAVWVDTAFAMPAHDNALVVALGVYAFAFQLYGDFSGYSDMARGVSRLLGIDLRINFNLPYSADNPSEFWRRWHISLSGWLRDYLFLPLSYAVSRRLDFERRLGVRVDVWVYTIAIVGTMLLGGLWHGANWTYVAWGGYHGLLLAASRVWPPKRRVGPVRRGVRVVALFHAVLAGWLLFRADTLGQAVRMLSALVLAPLAFAGAETMFVEVVGFVTLLVVLDGWLRNTDEPWCRPGFVWVAWLLIPLMCASLIVLAPPAGKSFIYFQF